MVVEAPLRSSCLTTAQWDATYDRPLMAVPGPVTSTASAGFHRLLRARTARLVTGAGDVTELLEEHGQTHSSWSASR